MKAKRELEVMKRENECKSKECEEALKSLRELQNELMRKSMHVGSLGIIVCLISIRHFYGTAYDFVVFNSFCR